MIANALEQHELQFAQEIVDEFGGTFIGPAERGFPGIDGSFNGVAASLKETQGGLSAVLTHASKAERQALKAGETDVDLFIKAVNVSKDALLDFASKGGLSKIPTQGTIARIWVLTKDGWVQIIP